MANALTILTIPNPKLFEKCRNITPEEILASKINVGNDETMDLKQLINDMIHAMMLNDGCGLAAPQVGITVRLFVGTVGHGNQSTFHIINPIISNHEGTVSRKEGCLSVPGEKVIVQRSSTVLISGITMNGDSVCFKAKGILSTLCQHECDHLDGLLMINRA
jgi:peptide deformylase